MWDVGPERQLVDKDEYWQLILAGVGRVEACRQVGIARTTGHRWRAYRAGCHHCGWPRSSAADSYLTR